MKENLKVILSNLSADVDQETLLLYLQGKLSAEQQHELEKSMMDNEFAADAFEGLQSFKNSQQVQILAEQLNRDLKKKTEKKKAYRNKLRLKQEPWILVAVIFVLLLAIISYMIIHRYLRP